jgi:hypothetical protein
VWILNRCLTTGQNKRACFLGEDRSACCWASLQLFFNLWASKLSNLLVFLGPQDNPKMGDPKARVRWFQSIWILGSCMSCRSLPLSDFRLVVLCFRFDAIVESASTQNSTTDMPPISYSSVTHGKIALGSIEPALPSCVLLHWWAGVLLGYSEQIAHTLLYAW